MDYISTIKAQLEQKNPLYIKVKVFSKAAVTEIFDQLEDETYKVKVAAQPVRGKANAELLKFLTKTFGLSDASIISGNRDKVKLIKLSL